MLALLLGDRANFINRVYCFFFLFFLPRLTPASLSARFGATFRSLVSHFHCGIAPGWCVLACRLEAGPGDSDWEGVSFCIDGILLFMEACKYITDLDYIM